MIKKKSIVRISGGLGNQLFQLSFAKIIEIVTGVDPSLDITNYQINTKSSRDLYLKDLSIINHQIKLQYFSNFPIYKLISNEYLLEALRKFDSDSINKRKKVNGLPVQKENTVPFDKHIDILKSSYFNGSFISPRYWLGKTNEVFNYINSLFHEELKQQFPNTLAIHIRRGDYLNNPKTRNFHGYCTISYFENAITLALNKFPEIDNILISSDTAIVAEKLRNKILHKGISSHIASFSDPVSLIKIFSLCGNFIGSNSTLSWWIAHLGMKKNVFLPDSWFLTLEDQIDLVPSRLSEYYLLPNSLSNNLEDI